MGWQDCCGDERYRHDDHELDTVSAGWIAAGVRFFAYDANAFVLGLVSRFANSRVMNVLNSAGAQIMSIREAVPVAGQTAGGLEVFANKENGDTQHYLKTGGTDPFVVFGGLAADRVGTNRTTCKGGLHADSLTIGSGGVSGLATAGMWDSPIKLGPDSNPTWIWGNAGNLYKKGGTTAPTSATDGTALT